MKSHPHWNLEEFTTFLLLYASSIDTVISDEEKELLLEHVDEAQLAIIREEFDSTSDYGKIQIILAYKDQFFPDEESRNQLFGELKSIFEADGKFSVMEKSMMHLLNKIM